MKHPISKGITVAKKAIQALEERGRLIYERKKPAVVEKAEKVKEAAWQGMDGAAKSAREAVVGVMDRFRYSDGRIEALQRQIYHQGSTYREVSRMHRDKDALFLGGETLAALMSASRISEDIEAAYAAAFPGLAATVDLREKLRELDGERLTGFLSALKGKLFEQKYVEYLNSGNLPYGYSASLAASAVQPGWDIQIAGPNAELAETIQAKATDSVAYVKQAIAAHPEIDVVTTKEVYNHLVMTGANASGSFIDGGITNASLEEALNSAVDSAELSVNFTPPLITLAFIAFTSYRDDNLSLYEKARSAGERSGKAYISYLLGGFIGAVTNTWWLGVAGSVASRYLSDKGKGRRKVYAHLKKVHRENEVILRRMETKLTGPAGSWSANP